jgi:hypothetical protein
MPKVDAGNPGRIYTLGKAGAEFIESEGRKVAWRVLVERWALPADAQLDFIACS